jgi:hypothetical protein
MGKFNKILMGCFDTYQKMGANFSKTTTKNLREKSIWGYKPTPSENITGGITGLNLSSILSPRGGFVTRLFIQLEEHQRCTVWCEVTDLQYSKIDVSIFNNNVLHVTLIPSDWVNGKNIDLVWGKKEFSLNESGQIVYLKRKNEHVDLTKKNKPSDSQHKSVIFPDKCLLLSHEPFEMPSAGGEIIPIQHFFVDPKTTASYRGGGVVCYSECLIPKQTVAPPPEMTKESISREIQEVASSGGHVSHEVDSSGGGVDHNVASLQPFCSTVVPSYIKELTTFHGKNRCFTLSMDKKSITYTTHSGQVVNVNLGVSGEVIDFITIKQLFKKQVVLIFIYGKDGSLHLSSHTVQRTTTSFTSICISSSQKRNPSESIECEWSEEETNSPIVFKIVILGKTRTFQINLKGEISPIPNLNSNI